MNEEGSSHLPSGLWASKRKKLSTRPDYPKIVLFAALFGTATSSYPVTVLSASLPRVARDLGTSDDSVTWVLAAPLLAFAVITPIAGNWEICMDIDAPILEVLHWAGFWLY